MNLFKKLFLISSIIIIACLLTSCDDDNNVTGSDTVSIYGHYEVLSVVGLRQRIDFNKGTERIPVRGFNPQDVHYLEFNRDHLVSVLLATDGGFRNIQDYVFLNSGAQIYFYNYVFNIYKNRDTLMLWTPEDTILAINDPTAPSREEWITELIVDQRLESSVSIDYDITLKNNSFWATSYTKIFKIDATNGSPTDTIPTSAGFSAIDWMGDSLWIGGGSSNPIFAIDTITGAIIDSTNFVVPYLNSIAYDGTDLYCTGGYGVSLLKYEPVSGTLLDSIRIDRYTSGMTYFNGYLYMVTEGVINKCTTDPFEIVNAYHVPGVWVRGITHDDTGLWTTSNEWNSVSMQYFTVLRRFIP